MKSPRFFWKRFAFTTRRATVAANDLNAEPQAPGAVILQAVSEIATSFEADGFRFVRSSKCLKKQDGDLTFVVSFQSDRNNFAGHRAAVWIHGLVQSKSLQKWRRSQFVPLYQSAVPETGWLGGIQIGSLQDPPVWAEWDFADPVNRSKEVASAADAIRSYLLPYFDRFKNPEQTYPWLLSGRHGAPLALIELLLSRGSEESAIGAARFLMGRYPPRFAEAVSGWRSTLTLEEIPIVIGDQAKELAAIAKLHGLDF